MSTSTPPRLTPPEDQVLTKANEAIAIKPKRGKLTLLSRRLYNALLYHSQRQGVDKKKYTIPLNELIGDARFNSNNTQLLKNHLRDMQATTIEWSTSAAGLNRWTSSQLLGPVTIDEQGRGKVCYITWEYPDDIRERLVKPNQYTKVLLEIGGEMRSHPAAVLYEIGARYLTSPGRLSMRNEVLWWAAVLTGRSDIDTVDYRFLKRDVISKALAEVDALCPDFSLELIEHKQGRKVEELQFRVIPKAQTSIGDGGAGGSPRNVFDLELVGRMINLGIKQEDSQELYATNDEALIRSTLDMTEARQKNFALAPLDAPAAYFKDALKKGYARLAPPDPKAPKALSATAPKPALPTDKYQELKLQWTAARDTQARRMYDEMLEVDQVAARHTFEVGPLADMSAPIKRSWKDKGLDSRTASAAFYRWLANTTWPGEPTPEILLAFKLEQG